MYLLDTNIWLWRRFEAYTEEELRRTQVPPGKQPEEVAQEVRDFLGTFTPKEIFITDFSLYSLGIKLIRMKRFDLLNEFIKLLDETHIVKLKLGDFPRLIDIVQQYELNFNDAYQYVAAEKVEEEKGEKVFIVSYDADFDRTPKGCLTPQQVLKLELEGE